MHQKIEFHDWINIYTHILNRGDIIIHRWYNLIDSNESEIYCHDGWKQRSRLYSKIVGWNPPSPSIKMSERVSKSREMANFARKKKKREKERKKILVGDPEPDLPGALSKIYYRREEILFKVRDIRIILRASIFLFRRIISITFY